jgi:hypothetical protein
VVVTERLSAAVREREAEEAGTDDVLRENEPEIAGEEKPKKRVVRKLLRRAMGARSASFEDDPSDAASSRRGVWPSGASSA